MSKEGLQTFNKEEMHSTQVLSKGLDLLRFKVQQLDKYIL